MVSYADVCVFSEHLTKKPQRLSRDDARDSTRYFEEIENSVTLGRAPRSFPRYDGQFHIDFWLSKAEGSFVRVSVPEEDKCDRVAKVLSEDVFKAYDAMQCNRIHRGEAVIKDWPTLKAILRYVFLPLTQLDTATVLLVHLPSPDDRVSDLSRKDDSLSSSSCSCSSNKDVGERDVLKEMINAFQHKLALATKENQEIQDLLVQCWRMLSPAPSTVSSSTLRHRHCISTEPYMHHRIQQY